MINLNFETLVIIILVAFILGVLIGVERGKPSQF